MRILYLTANPQFVNKAAVLADDPEKTGKEANAEQKKKYVKKAKLDLWPELREVSDALFDARADGSVRLEVVPETRMSDISRYIERFKPNVVHFSGHGEDNRLVLSDDRFRGVMPDGEWLKGILADKGIDVLLLNCCWSDSLAKPLEEVVGVTIGTTNPLGSDLAAEFSKEFYQSLLASLTVEGAFTKAKEKVEGKKTEDEDPGLYLATPNEKADAWTKPLDAQPAAEPGEPSLADTLNQYDTRLDVVSARFSTDVGWDFFKFFIGLLFACLGYYMLSGEVSRFLDPNSGDYEFCDLIVAYVCDDPPRTAIALPEEGAAIGLAKSASVPVAVGEGGYQTTLTFNVKNFAAGRQTGLQITDDLTETFSDEALCSVVPGSLKSADLKVNDSFDCDGDTKLLAEGNELGSGESARVSVAVRFEPGEASGPFSNQAVVITAEGANARSTDGTTPYPFEVDRGWMARLGYFVERYLQTKDGDDSWVHYEPFALFLALSSVPIARLVSYFWIATGIGAARGAIGVARNSEVYAERYLLKERIETMFSWLQEYDKDE